MSADFSETGGPAGVVQPTRRASLSASRPEASAGADAGAWTLLVVADPAAYAVAEPLARARALVSSPRGVSHALGA